MAKESAIIQAAGGRYIGIQDGCVFFDDPITHSTLMLSTKDLTVEKVKRHLEHSRKEFEEVKEINRRVAADREQATGELDW